MCGLKRQQRLDSTTLSQAEQMNQRLQREVAHYKSTLEQTERLLQTARHKEEDLRNKIYSLEEEKKELETTILNLQRDHEVYLRNQEMTNNYRVNNSSQVGYQQHDVNQYQQTQQSYGQQNNENRNLPRPSASHTSSPRKNRSNTTNLLYHYEHKPSHYKNDDAGREMFHDRRNNVGSGVMGRAYSENNRYSATSPTGKSMVDFLGKKANNSNINNGINNMTSQSVSPTQANVGKRNHASYDGRNDATEHRTENRIFPSSPTKNHRQSKSNANNSPVIDSNTFPIDVEATDVDINSGNTGDSQIRSQPGHSQDQPPFTTMSVEPAVQERAPTTNMVEAAQDNTSNHTHTNSIMSFQEAMENARRKKGTSMSPAAMATATQSASFSIPTPQKQAAKFAANQSRPHFKIEDPPSSRVRPVTLMTEKTRSRYAWTVSSDTRPHRLLPNIH